MRRLRRRRRILSTAIPLATVLGSAGVVPQLASPRPVAVASTIPAALPVVDPTAALATALCALAPDLRMEALRPALDAWERLRGEGVATRPLLTVVDYGLPSTQPRLWVFDLDARRLLYHELVAHGRNTGDDLATMFSNDEGSLQTSLGSFVTGTSYTGRNGYSMRLRGLDPGRNDHAEARAIVMHGASYVDPDVARKLGRLGRSWGCPAVRPAIAHDLIDRIKDGSVFFAWHPSLASLAH
ncbi:MAG TPA: murein L,D-transpeptidase catalytic domain family protein [Candidatus Polarisedimenticolaceae bacterium]|nr:murein L,D-transpeptidase catalytic domain family protein [Candidatus Polarisedimenticolaceae bacterium]